MNSDDLSDLQQENMYQSIADALSIDIDTYHELEPELIYDDEHPYVLVIEFSKESPKELLSKIKGLKKGDHSMRIDWYFDDDSYNPDDWNDDDISDHDNFIDDEFSRELGRRIAPFHVFNLTMLGLSDIIDECDLAGNVRNTRSSHIKLRMIFIQLFSALETYLGDTLQYNVRENKQAIFKIISEHKTLKDQRFLLKDIFVNHKFVQDKVHEHLQSILYHDLLKVGWHFKHVLDIEFWPNPEIMKKLLSAIPIRHDCVHRNGKNKNDEPISEVQSISYIREIKQSAEQLVIHINNAIIKSINTNKDNKKNSD